MLEAEKLSRDGYSVEEIQDELGYGIVDERVLLDTFGD